MIFDTLEHVNQYKGLSVNLDKALDYIVSRDFSNMEEATVEIDGKNVYAMIQRYETEGAEGREYEAHRKYIDLQFLAAGYETMICRGIVGLTTSVPYNGEKDAEMFALNESTKVGPELPYAGGTEVRMKPGEFVIFFPQDAHVPKIQSGVPGPAVKVVVKVRLGD